MTTGQEPGVQHVPPYVASILFFTINMVSGIFLRTLSSAFLPQPVRGLVIDFLCTMEACAYFFENNFVLKVGFFCTHYLFIFFNERENNILP